MLVVILIIGILAAIAIPAFLSQKAKAVDAGAKTLVNTAETTAETIATDNAGSYATVSTTTLHEYEKGDSGYCQHDRSVREQSGRYRHYISR